MTTFSLQNELFFAKFRHKVRPHKPQQSDKTMQDTNLILLVVLFILGAGY